MKLPLLFLSLSIINYLMNPEELHFDNAPSIETIFLIRSSSIKEMSLEDFENKALEIIDNNFNEKRIIRFNDVKFRANDAEMMDVHSTSGWLGIEFRDTEKQFVLRLQKDGLSFHKLKPYTSFTDILPQMKELWRKYCEVFQPAGVSKIGLRFVNRIELPNDVTAENLSDYLSVVPHVKLPSETDIKNVLSRVHVESNELNGYISFSNVSTIQPNIEAVILDIDTWQDQDLSASNQSIWSNFSELRTFKNKLFLESLTKKCLTLFN